MTKEKCWYCGAEKKVSKKGNLYCPNICWEKDEYKKEFKRQKHIYDNCDATEIDIY